MHSLNPVSEAKNLYENALLFWATDTVKRHLCTVILVHDISIKHIFYRARVIVCAHAVLMHKSWLKQYQPTLSLHFDEFSTHFAKRFRCNWDNKNSIHYSGEDNLEIVKQGMLIFLLMF